MYEDILKLTEIYDNANMKDIKKNLKDIFKYRKYNKGFLNIIGIGMHQERSYLNQAHPHSIPFLTLIKICNFLNVSLEDLVKENNSLPDRNRAKNKVKWTEDKQKQLLKDIEEIGIEETCKKYQLSLESIAKYKVMFNKEIIRNE